MLKERLKSMDLRLTELADYLQISRPTMYKYIDYYEEKNFDQINKNVLKLFNYIMENELIGKKNVINFVLTNLVDIGGGGEQEEKTLSAVKKLLTSNPESKKSKFIGLCVAGDTFDRLIYYLVDIKPLLEKKKPNAEEQKILQPYLTLLEKIKEIDN